MSDLKEVRVTVTSKNQSFPIDTKNTQLFWDSRFSHIQDVIARNPEFIDNNKEWAEIAPLQLQFFITRPDENTMILHRVFNNDASVDLYFNKWMSLFEKHLESVGFTTSFDIINFDPLSIGQYDFVFYLP